MRFEHQIEFREHLDELIHRARLLSYGEIAERPADDNRRGEFRCDISIPRRGREGVAAIVECETRTDQRSLCDVLGRALVNSAAFGADHAMVCFPPSASLPASFVDACEESGVTLTMGDGILEALAERDLIEPAVASFLIVKEWLSSQDFSKWTVEELKEWKERLRPLCELYAELCELRR